MKLESFSIIMPAYNATGTIEKSIESVLAQSYKNWVLYIIEDCSSDHTFSLISKYKEHDNIRILKNESNLGVAGSRNKGLEACSEDIICFLDSDDIWHPDKLKAQHEEILKDNLFLVTSYNYVEKKVHLVEYDKDILTRDDFLKKKFRVCFSSLCYVPSGKKVFFEAVGHEDFIYINEVFNIHDSCKVIREPMVSYQVIEGSLSSNKVTAALWHYKALEKILSNKIKVFYYFIFYAINAIKFTRSIKK
ncbi:glycosyltransferase family 2 protein [Tatumella sp. JGM118]|uniref:glycosyltransferase family 2 protein n=1 Tax=Tatumella sp. JGM118 TaxID=2799796 RepID=UPI001BB02109|nr:glycosyltransferase family 2 protein [Tatumella sp. JGM118]MBS0910038.1 glycosyltransferase family 2 protein [Tatumella sp. JGM118]